MDTSPFLPAVLSTSVDSLPSRERWLRGGLGAAQRRAHRGHDHISVSPVPLELETGGWPSRSSQEEKATCPATLWPEWRAWKWKGRWAWEPHLSQSAVTVSAPWAARQGRARMGLTREPAGTGKEGTGNELCWERSLCQLQTHSDCCVTLSKPLFPAKQKHSFSWLPWMEPSPVSDGLEG